MDDNCVVGMTKEEYEQLAEFRYLLRTFIAFIESKARLAGLTPQQHQAMLATFGTRGRDSISVGELARRLLINHNSAVGLIDRLVKLGYMKREADASDLRRVLVSLTPEGIEKLRSLSEVHQAEIARIGPELQLLVDRIHGALDRTSKQA